MPEATILIVDDDRTIVRYCQRLLERASYQVYTALQPLEALKVLSEQKIDLLLSDIRMPVMDGFELITRAKQVQPGLPVLVMTGFGSVDTAIQALHRGVDGLILKPFENGADLVQAVQRVLTESRQKQDASRLQALRPIFDVSETLMAETSPQSLGKLILNAITGLFQASFTGIYRKSPEGGYEPVRTSENSLMQNELRIHLNDLIQSAASSATSLVINATGPGKPELQAIVHELGWEAALVASIRRNEQLFIFYAGRTEQGAAPFTEADLEMFVILARQATVALENARLYSELKDYVRQVEESQRALIQAEKMAAVGRLMASLAHEINNPLQAVRNCLHLAARRNIETEQRLHYIQMTDSELDRLVNTVRRMLDFYRAGRIEKEDVQIKGLVEKVLALLDGQIQTQRIKVYTSYTGTPASLSIVPDQIQQVFFNLLINAMDALEDARDEKEIWIDVIYEDNQVRICIEDSGPGISDWLREHIFEPFVSTKKNGTGLGLAVSYGIIERHKGILSIHPPRHKQGACFEIVLPIEAEGDYGKSPDRR